MRVTLRDYTPIERLGVDDTPWVEALIYEATDAAGTGATLIDTITLDPIDTDPANPSTRVFVTTLATLTTGWYSVVWQDASLTQSPTPYVQNLAVTRAWRPLVSDVAELIRGRTTDRNGTEQGTFTAATRPTYEQADRVIDNAVRKLEAKFGPTMKAELIGSAAMVVALYSAAMIELSFFGEQIAPGRSPYPQLLARYEDALADWILERKQLGGDDTPDTDDDQSAAGLPAYSFPSIGGPFPGPYGNCSTGWIW